MLATSCKLVPSLVRNRWTIYLLKFTFVSFLVWSIVFLSVGLGKMIVNDSVVLSESATIYDR